MTALPPLPGPADYGAALSKYLGACLAGGSPADPFTAMFHKWAAMAGAAIVQGVSNDGSQ